MSPRKYLDEARKHLGYQEPPNGVTRYGAWYAHRVGNAAYRNGAWCDMFLSFVADQTGTLSQVGAFAYTVDHAKWFHRQERFNRHPEPGALVFFDWGGSQDLNKIDHIGVVEAVRPNGDLITIEGNTDDRVARRVRTMDSVVGFGHPNWETKPMPKQQDRKFRVVATTRFGGVRFVYRLPGGYTWHKGKQARLLMTAHEAAAGKEWAKKRAAKNTRVLLPGQYSHLRLAPGVTWPTDDGLLRRLNRVGREMNRVVYLKSGLRTIHDQTVLWNAWQAYLHGGPYANRAAPPNPNAPHVRGVAADVGILDRRGNYTSLGLVQKAKQKAEKYGLRAWVSGEPWHWQRTQTY